MPTKDVKGDVGGKVLPWFVAAGFRFENPSQRLAIEATLCFGPFENQAEAKKFWCTVLRVIGSQSLLRFEVPRLHRSYGGALWTEAVHDQPLTTLRGRHAFAQLDGYALGRLSEAFAMVPIAPEDDIDIDWFIEKMKARVRSLLG